MHPLWVDISCSSGIASPVSGVTLLRVILCVVHYAVSAWVVSITSGWARSGWQGGGLWWGEQGHGCFGEVAAVADLPFVVRLDQDTPDETDLGQWD